MQTMIQMSQLVMIDLIQCDEEQLFEKLGIRAKAYAQDVTVGNSFDPDVTYDGAQMGAKEDVLEFGRRLFYRWNTEAYKLICGSDPNDRKDREELVNAFGAGEVAVAAVLTSLLVSHFTIVPAIATVVAALLVKRFFRPAHEEFCHIWEKKLQVSDLPE